MKNLAFIMSFSFITILDAQALSYKTTINAAAVPKLFVSQKLPEIKYSSPGEMSFNVKRMCGDGDVAHHQQENPTFDYVDQGIESVVAVMGAWVVKDGEALVPNGNNWIPFGYSELEVPMWPQTETTIPEEQAYRYHVEWVRNNGKFRLVNGLYAGSDPSSKKIDGLTVLSDNIPKIVNFAKNRFEKNDNYRIYSGIFVCLEPKNKSEVLNGSDDFKAGLMDVAFSFADTELFSDTWSDSEITSKISSGGTLASNLKFKVKETDDLVLLDEGSPSTWSIFETASSGANLFEANFSDIKSYKAAQNLLALEYPTKEDGSDLDSAAEYNSKNRAMLNSSFDGVFSPAFTSENYYKDVCGTAALNLKGQSYYWEKVGAMDISCQILVKEDFKSGMKVLFDAGVSDIPTRDAFKGAKEKVIKALYKAAVAKAIQVAVNDSSGNNQLKYAKNGERPHCFATVGSEPLINKMIYAVPLIFTQEDGKWRMGNVSSETSENYSISGVHPEPLFALKDFFEDYTTSLGDQHTVFGMVNTPTEFQENPASMAIPTNLESVDFDDKTFKRALDIEIRIRSVGGACPFYC